MKEDIYVWLYQKKGVSKRFKVHRLVAKSFIPNPDNKPEVNHKGENPNKQDNRVWMIEWATKKENDDHARENGLYHTTAKLSEEQVLAIKNSKEKAKNIYKEYGVSLGTIYSIRSGKSWGHVKL